MAGAYLGSGGRLSGGPAPELVDAGFAAECAAAPRLAVGLSLSDLAHSVALAEAGAIPADQAAALLRGLLELHEIPGADFPWDPALGDAFNSREHELRERVGPAAAGWLSAGRPRREAFRVGLRLVARDGAARLHDAVAARAAALVAQAREHADDLTADYTYLQPAQPSTVGHLLLAHAAPALRDAARLRAVHAELDLSVAGAGGSAGSRWPLDRERLAELLGAAGVVPHVKDAMWQVDPYLDLTGAVATQALHASMLGQDLEIACSHEFGQVRLAEGHSRASALMPQKRNPYALAVIRAFAGTAAGEHAGLLVVLHTGSARTDHFHVLNTVVPRLLDEAVSVARLAVAVVEGMSIDRAAMERPARDGFVTAADVADVMAQRGGLDYRAAHTVVGRAVRVLSESGRTADDLTPELLDGAISPDDLVHALDPVAAVASRRQTGSTRPGEVRRMADRMGREAEEARAWGAAAAKRAAAAAERLLARARALATAG